MSNRMRERQLSSRAKYLAPRLRLPGLRGNFFFGTPQSSIAGGKIANTDF